MVKYIAIFLTFFLFSNSLFCQFESNLNKVLSGKDFLEFTVYLENLSKKEDNVIWNWEYLRDITNEYQEGILFLEKSNSEIEEKGAAIRHRYKVSLITTKRYIAYFKFEKEFDSFGNFSNEIGYERISELKDSLAYVKFENSFTEIYNTKMNKEDLFNTKITYGESCGLTGLTRPEMIKISEFVANNDKTNLLIWLGSANTEKQIFAIDGLYQLKLKGLNLNEKELALIEFVLNKNGTFYSCSGCFF